MGSARLRTAKCRCQTRTCEDRDLPLCTPIRKWEVPVCEQRDSEAKLEHANIVIFRFERQLAYSPSPCADTLHLAGSWHHLLQHLALFLWHRDVHFRPAFRHLHFPERQSPLQRHEMMPCPPTAL